MYLDANALEMYGPDAVKPQAPVAAPVAPTEGPEAIYALQEQLFSAQRSGDNAQIAKLSIQLDDALSSLPVPHADSTQDAPEAAKATDKGQTSQDEFNSRYEASEVRSELNGKYGAEVVNQVHDWCNLNLTESELGEYIGLLNSDDPEAVVAFESLKTMASDEALAPDPEGVEYSGFSQEQTDTLISNYGDHGQIMLQLNQDFMSGKITQQQMQRRVLSDPMLALSVFDAKSKNLITY